MENTERIGCLIIHGFCGSQREIKPLADALEVKGYEILTPSLKGHTGVRRDLLRVTYLDWLDSAREGLKQLQQTCEKIVVIGFSMGGLLAINLANENSLAGLVTINTPIYIWALRQIAANILEDIKSKNYRHLEYYVSSARKAPWQAQWQFLMLLRKTKPLLKKTRVSKALILQVSDDSTVKPKSGKYLYDHLNASEKILKYYPQGGHLVLLSAAQAQVIEDVEKFLSKI